MPDLIKKNNFLILYLLIIVAFNLFLQTLPLTNVFGYEYSALNALLLSFLSGLYAISLLKRSVREKVKFNSHKLKKFFVWILFIPLIISIVKSVIFGFCSFCDGVSFYLVITVPSVFIGSALGAVSYSLLKKFSSVLFIVIYLFILLISVLEIYFNPQVYLFNPLFAYFPGTIYDEGLSVDFNLILYRIFNLIFFFPLLIFSLRTATKILSFKKRSSIIFITISVASAFYFLVCPSLGFTTTESSIKEHLSMRAESEHFIVQADRKISKNDLKFIVLNQEYYYNVLNKYFNEYPQTKINSYIFYNTEQKKNLFGSGAADIAKPWLNSIYVSLDSWGSTLKHEIAHCFTAGFGTGIFKLASGFNPALIEGVAEAADGFYDENDIHILASLAYKNDFKVDLNKVFSSFSFFSSVSTLSYIYSGSFIKYLKDEYGIQNVKEFYRDGDFNKVFSNDLNSIVSEYELFLDTLKITQTISEANYYFGRKPLISKVCPRYISSSIATAWGFYRSEKYSDAENIFEDILQKTESYSAVVGLAKIYEIRDSLSKAVEVYENHIINFSETASEFDLKLRLADLYIMNNQEAEANNFYKLLSNARPNRRLTLISETRLALIQKDLIKGYVDGSEFDKYEILKKMNFESYLFGSIPIMIDLSESLGEDYHLFLENFEKDFEVKNESASYAVLKLSEYMLKNFDYVRARKMAGFAIRFKNNLNLQRLTEKNYYKAEWFLRNAETIFQNTKIEQ